MTSADLRNEARRRLGLSGGAAAGEPLRVAFRAESLAWYPLIALGLLAVVDVFQGYAFTVLAPEISDTLGLGHSTVAALIAAKTLAVAVAPLPMAALTQRRPRRALLAIVTALLWSVVAITTGFVVAAWGLLLVLILDGLTTGSVSAVHQPLLLDSYPARTRVRVLSGYQASSAAGNVLAPLGVALIAGALGFTWRGVFVIFGIVSLVSVLVATRLRDPGFGHFDEERIRSVVDDDVVSQERDSDTQLGFFEVVRRLFLIPTIRRLLGSLAVFGVLLIPFQTFLLFFLAERWNLGPGGRGLFFALTAAVSIVGFALLGKRGDRRFQDDPGGLLRMAGRLLAVAVLLVAAGGLVPWFVPMLALFALGGAIVPLLTPIVFTVLYSVIPSEMRPHAAALAGIAVGGVGGLAGALFLSGIDSRFGVGGALVALVVPGVLGALLLASTGKLVAADLDHMIDEVLEDEDTRSRQRAGEHLPLLQCRGIDFSYGQLQVLFGVDFSVDDGEMVALLGVNGAGKSTLLRAISGLGLPGGGSIRLRGKDITYLDAERRVNLGIAQVPGGRAIFGPLSVADNLRGFAHTLHRSGRELDAALDTCFAAFPRLAERRNQPASTLSGGEQQMLALSKALLLKPQLLLIDELSLGLAPIIVEQLLVLVREINRSGTAVVLVEQSVNIALNLVDHAYFMEKGEIRFDGRASDLIARDDLLRAVFLEGAGFPMTGSLLALVPFGFELPLPVIVLGAITGITYGLLAVGIVLVYRSNKIINFAHGEIGAFGAAVLVLMVNRWHVPYYIAALAVLAVAGGVGALAEVAVVRRLKNAPRLMSIVATLGVGQLLVFLGLVLMPGTAAGFFFPSPPGLPTFQFGGLKITQAHTGILVFGPLVVIALTLFLRRGRFGLAMRCAAANPESARLSGISASAMSSLSWALAGGLSAFTAILVLPARGFAGGESFGPGLLLRALVGAVLARMESLPLALAAGVGLGVTEQLILWNKPNSSIVDVVLFGVIVVALLLQRGTESRKEEKGSWAATQGWRPLREHVQRLPEVRFAPYVLAFVGLVGAVLLPFVVTSSATVTLTQIGCFAIVGVSIAIATGLGGQLSLGQMAIAGIGAVVSYQVSSRVGAFPLAFFYAGLVAAGVSVLVGLPALRVRGLLLTVTTLGFGLAASGWLLSQSWAFGAGVDPGRPIFFGHALDSSREYYWFALVVLVLVLLLAWNVRRGAVGRLMVAVRDNEDNARAFTVKARLVRLQGFALAGFVAGIGGATFGHLLPSLGASAFPNRGSIDVVAMAVIGGTSLLVGPLLGALYIIGIPAFLPLDSAGLAATQLGWLILVLYLPGGLAQALQPVRTRYVRWAAARHGVDPDFDPEPQLELVEPTRVIDKRVAALGRFGATAEANPARSGVLLQATGLARSFGGVRAVDGVDIEVREGEIVGLIGPNGAGKTTTFELLGGFTLPDEGRVAFDGEDVSDLGPEARASRGLIRSFQDAALFPTLSVLDTARLAFERTAPSSFLASVLGLRGTERDKDRMARALIGTMGLDRYRHATIQELSTGTRRITELACLVALQPRCLLLDEPSSGVAQRETEALGRLLHDLHKELGIAMVVIEHDIPLIMGLSDRIIAMDAGRVIANGAPEVVRHHPEVVASYLGGDITAVARSGATTARKKRKEVV